MDFGKWIDVGLPFADEKEEIWLRKRYLEEPAQPAEGANLIVLTKPTDIVFFDRQWAGLTAAIGKNPPEPFAFEKCNSYLQKVIYQQVAARLQNVVVEKKNDVLVATKLSEEAVAAHQLAKSQEREVTFKKAMGFRLILNLLVAMKKKIVGHNCFFDILFILRFL